MLTVNIEIINEQVNSIILDRIIFWNKLPIKIRIKTAQIFKMYNKFTMITSSKNFQGTISVGN